MDHDDPVNPIDPDLAPADSARPDPSARSTPARPPRRDHGRAEPDVLVAIVLGGMLGASARYAIARALATHPGGFPWATFWTNLAGSFLLGLLLVFVGERFPPTRYVRPFLGTGVLGAFTTMSTFEVETAELLKDGHLSTASLYAVGSLMAGLVLAYTGIVAGRLVPHRHPEGTR